MRLNLQLSCYNGARYLPYLFASLARQTRRDWHIYVLDNASNPENEEGIKKAVAESGLPITLYRVNPNIGFAGAHNYLFEKHATESELVQLLNDDAILEPDYLEKVAAFMEGVPSCAAAAGIIYRWNFEARDEANGGRTNIIDSLGLAVKMTGAVHDEGAGSVISSEAQPSREIKEVFGISGCLPMYRAEAVRKVKFGGPLFDGSFVTYKEDVDLAFRLQAAGYSAAVVTDAVAYHRRSYGIGSKAKPSEEAKSQSYRNHLWIALTHFPNAKLGVSFWAALIYEKMKCAYWLVRCPRYVVKAFRDTRSNWKMLMEKRKFMKSL